MKIRILINVLATAMMIFQTSAMAEDIDLFVGTTPSTTEVPNVLIILDNTGNWTAPFTNEKAALVSVFNALPADKFRVGLLMFTETGSGNTGNDGAYVRGAVRLMTSANKALYASMINSFDSINDKSNSGKAGKTMAEAYYYFAGLAPYAGNNKNKTDWGTVSPSVNTYNPNPPALGASLAPSRAVWAIADDNITTKSFHALTSKSGSPYRSPIVAGCAKNFIIWISNGAAQDSNADITAATTLLASAGGNTATIPLTPSGSQTNVADEWARFMKSSLGITTYTVDINKVTTGQGPGWTELLESMADVSGGKYFDVDSTTNAGQEISDALNDIFSEIQATNSVFASVSLPASANAQSRFLNQIFVGMFRPDGSSFPRWAGNLKQYKLGLVNNEVRTLDADDNPAINSTTGFITECARSFWTPTSVDDYWDFKESFFTDQGGCLTVAGSDGSNYPDGKIVEKGGQAYSLRSTTSRTVYTCPPTFSACTTLTSFNTGNTAITEALLGASDAADRASLINWGFGLDVAEPSPNPDNLHFDDENNNNVTLTEMRPSAHGDVVHSRPVAINYGTDAAPQVVVFYGSNDGMLRGINGNRENASGSTANNIGTVEPGGEFWAFMPPEFYPHIKRIRDNSITINYPGSTVTDAEPKPYGMDGPVTTYEGEISGTDKVFIYASMRRGGRALYAFDVTTPASPTLKWKIGCPNANNDTGCAVAPSTIGDISGIGQTWSPATSLFASGYGSGTSPLLIMGGGYDECEDTDNGTVNHTCTSSDKGRNIYVLDANTGELLKAFDTDRGVIGNITIVPDSSNLAIYAYAADLGGNIYRITIGSAAPASWTITKIAALGCGPTAIDTCSANRKFMFAPDVVADGGTYYVIIGSGDREKPLLSYTAAATVANYFFMIKDVPSDATWLTDEMTNCSDNVMCLASLTPILTSATPSDADLDVTKGWYLGLASTEQVVTSALTISDVVTFSSHIPATPDPNSCGNNLGTARVYNINFRNAEGYALDGSRYGDVAGGGLAPSPVGGTVTLDNGETVPFLIGGSTDSSLQGGNPGGTASWVQPKSRVYWYIEQ